MTKTIFFLSFLFSFISASSQTVDFSYQTSDGLFCQSSTIQFTQTCTGNPTGFVWDLGNGLKDFTPNPSTSYSNPGTYRVRLIAIYPTGAIEIIKTIDVFPDIKPSLSADRIYICQPGVINFTTASNGTISNYDWNFGDSTGIVATPGNITSHSYSALGNYSVIVKATDASGCFGLDTLAVTVKKLPITATATPVSGCIPANVTFRANVTPPLNDAVSNYEWDFGNSVAPVSTVNNTTTNSYTTVGSYLPKVKVTTNDGCTNTFDFPAVAFGIPPTNHVAYAKDSVVCGSETPVFVAKATNANRYQWNFGDGTSVMVTDTVTSHKYKTLGVKTVTVIPLFNGCTGTSIRFQIRVTGVIAGFTNANTCIDKRTFSFDNISQGVQSSTIWNFGDGSPAVNTTDAVHTFPINGAFTTLLKITDSTTGCVDSLLRPIFTANPSLTNPDTSICKNSVSSFSVADAYLNSAAKYAWNVLGTKVNNDTTSVTVKATTLGNFNNFVVINNGSTGQYCPDTIYLSHQMLVRGPSLDFTSPTTVCFSNTVNITNNSKPFVPADSVTLWYWNYGNSTKNDTIYQPAPILYTAARNFRVILTGIDINGCKDSLIKRVIVSPLPFLSVLPHIDTLCSGQTDSLFAFHSNNILWTPSTGISCNTCDTVLANPSVTTQYTITASNANCSIQDSILVKVIPPFTAVPIDINHYICLNEQVTLDMDPKDKIIVWSPATGLSNTNIYNPVARPGQTTTYTSTLTDSVGCFTSTADVTVVVKSLPTVDAGPDRIVPFNSNFTITPTYSANVRSYLWSPSTLLSCSTCSTPNGTAPISQHYKIEVTSDSGCVATDSIFIAIECKDANLLMPKAFSPNNDNLNDYYYPLARGIKTILRFSIFNREGKILYEARNFPPNDKSFAWDGLFKGQHQAPRAYVFVLEAVCDAGQQLIKSGSFVLLR